MSGLVFFSDVGGLQGSGERCPRPGDVGGIRLGSADSLGQCPCSTSWAAKASPYSLVVCCMCRVVRRLFHRRVRPTGVGVLCCAVARCSVVPGAPLAKVGLPGVVAVDGRFRSRWLGSYRRGLPRDEVICRLLTCGWPERHSRRVCAAVRHRCTAGCRLRWAEHVFVVSVASCAPEGVFPVLARGGSGPRGVSHAPHECAAEGTEDLMHKGGVCRLGFVSVRIAGCSCSLIASARIWWIAKTGQRLVAVTYDFVGHSAAKTAFTLPHWI